VSVRRAENAETESCAADEGAFADTVGVPSAPYQCVDQPAADDEISYGGEEPGNAGVEEGVE
jgi:hypothetical protein